VQLARANGGALRLEPAPEGGVDAVLTLAPGLVTPPAQPSPSSP